MKLLSFNNVRIEIPKYLLLPLVVLLGNCTQNGNRIINKTYINDTLIKQNIIRDTTYKSFGIIKIVHDTIYLTNKDEHTFGLGDVGNLMIQEYYDSIFLSHFVKNVNLDTIRLSDKKMIVIKDTIQENKLLNRTYELTEEIL